MIAEALDTLITLGWAALAWLTVLAAVVSVVLLAGTAVGAWAVRGLWRHMIRPTWAHGRARARIFAARRVRRSTDRTAPHDYREAA